VVDGPYANFARRGETCRIYGHYWHRDYYNFSSRTWELVKDGGYHCGWCKQFRIPNPIPREPSWWHCFWLAVKRKEE